MEFHISGTITDFEISQIHSFMFYLSLTIHLSLPSLHHFFALVFKNQYY